MPISRPRVLAFFAAAVCLVASGCDGSRRAGPRPSRILLITLDTTRADRLGCYGYKAAATPALDALADGGVRFERAYTHVPLTLPSHCSLLTGLTPLGHQVRNNGFYRLGEDVPTLAESFRAAGFRTGAFVSSFTLDSRFGLDRGFDVYDDSFQKGEALKSFRSERRAAEVADAFLSWLAAEPGVPSFGWVHFFDPHLPYDPPPPFDKDFAGHGYDGEIASMDAAIGRILRALDALGPREGTLVVVAGDHGEALGERREIDHGLFLYENTVRVPLIFYWPGGIPDSTVVPSTVRLTDIMPTVLDLTGLDRPLKLQGVSLRPWMSGRRRDDLPVYLETFYPRENLGWSELVGLIDKTWKYIQAPRPELYDLGSDPDEAKDRVVERPDAARRHSERLEFVIAENTRLAPASTRAVSSEESARLRSLGYLGGLGTGIKLGRPLSDPKDKIDDYIVLYRGHLMEGAGRLEEALDCYRKVQAANPDVPGHAVNVGSTLMRLARPAEAVAELEEAARRFPDSLLVLSRLMASYLRVEQWDKALACGQRILEIEPRDLDALFLSGNAWAKLGKWEEALELYLRALDVEPENPVLRQRHAFALAAVGREKDALEAYARLKADHPDEPSFDRDIGRIYESMGEREKAREVFRASVERNPGPDSYHAYAMFLGRSKELAEAVRWLELYLAAAPDADRQRSSEARALLSRWRKSLAVR